MADVKNFGIPVLVLTFSLVSQAVVLFMIRVTLFKVTTDGTTLGNVMLQSLQTTNAANKAYVDSVASGLDVKDSVRAASTTDVNTATSTSSMV